MLSPGDRIDRYEVVELLGSGGMGEVYRAHDPRLDRPVALKIVRNDGALATNGHTRLLAEARAVAKLSHVNVLAVHDAGEVTEPERLRGLAYIAMELVVGSTLRARVGDEAVPMEQRIAWLRDVASGLGAAHEAGLVHRDVKPENVMIRFDGTVKVLDFGIARRTDLAVNMVSSIAAHSLSTVKSVGPSQAAGSGSGVGGLVGTLAYMAPEQLRGEVADARADQFAWGVVAYELLTGKSPWARAVDPIVVVSQILSHEPAPPAKIDPRIPRAVSNAIVRALAKDPSARFSSMKALLGALGGNDRRGREASGDRSASSAPSSAPPPSLARRPIVAIARAGALGLAVLGGLGLAWRFVPRGDGGAVSTETASLPAAHAAASDGGLRVGDDETLASTKPEAQAAYEAALGSYHDGTGRTEALLRHAVKLDDQFAGAYLRLAILGEDLDHADYRHVVALDAKLRPRERALLAAHEAYVAGGDQARAAAATLDTYLQAHPHDEIGWTQRWKLAALEGETRETETLDRAILANPSFLHALAVRAGLFPLETDGLHMMDRCMRANPRAVDCIARSMELDSRRGACDEEGSDARRLLLFQPDSHEGRDALANALAAGKAPVASIREALGPLDDSGSALLALPRAVYVPMLEGNFTEVERVARELLNGVATSRATEEHLRPTLALIAAYTESGDFKEAAKVAEDFQARISAWDAPEEWAFLDGFLASAMARGGRLTEAEASARKEALSGKLTAQGKDAYDAWGYAYGWGVVTEKEAREAVAKLDGAKLATDGARWQFEMLQALVLAGEEKRANRRGAEQLARECSVATKPEITVRSELYLGRVLERNGESSAACAAYTKVIDHWRGSRPRAIVADEVLRRSVRIGCKN